MEIWCLTFSYAKGKAKETNKRELIIKDELDRLDHIICSNADLTNITQELKQYDNLKKELQQLYQNACGLKKAKNQLNTSSILKKGITVGR